MKRLFRYLPWRLQTALVLRFFRQRHVNLIDRPSIDGLWPKIENDGCFNLGRKHCFRSYRLRQHITVKKGAELTIGDHSFMNDGVSICATKKIVIGDHVKIGDMVYIYDTDFHAIDAGGPVRQADVHIGKNVWIGSKAVILPGAVIGDHSVVGAGSVVTGQIPDRCLAAGSPARVIRSFVAADDWVRA
jgi:acetyltransferase-like isoleucine patch superfamily enzyme